MASSRSLHLFALQMGVMLESGVRLMDALQVASHQDDERFAEAVKLLRKKIEQGVSLSKAMADQPRFFSPLFIRLIAIAEETGAMALIFPRLADYLEMHGSLRRKLVSALIYPASVLGLSLVMVLILKFMMLPSFLKLVESTGTELPWLTRLIAFRVPWPVWVVLILAGVGLAEYLALGGKRRWRAIVHRLPWVGRSYYHAVWTRLARDLATMLGSGLPLLKAMTFLAEGGSGSEKADEAMVNALVGIRRGKSLTETLGSDPAVPGMLRHLLTAGEASGKVVHCLDRYARLQEETLYVELESAAVLVEPLLLGVLGIGVGIMLLGAFLPVYQMMLSI